MNDRVTTLLQGRKDRMARALGRPLAAPEGTDDPPLTEERKAYLLGEATDLYWNELEWENLTEEERVDGGPLAELAFPGLLAFVRGLLLEKAMPDAQAPAHPRPEVVHEILRFLARRVTELGDALPGEAGEVGEEGERTKLELAMTSRLVDLVLYELYGLTPEEVERVEAEAPTPAPAG